LEEAVELIEELNEVGISHVVFKPGTIEQIRSVIRIATEVPTKPVIMHIEGGRAGGHHSWEDLDDLLLATYSELRSRPNITVCVGGGIGTPEQAAEYLSGRWAQSYGFPLMPVDGILVGTAAMATLEATTSPSVKQMLVDTGGTDQWVGAGKAQAAWLLAAVSSALTFTRSTMPLRAAAGCSTRSPATATRSPRDATRSSPRWPTPPSHTSVTSAR
jgi:fatty acid synthase